MSGLTRENDRQSTDFRLRGYHPLWRNFPGPSASPWISYCRLELQLEVTLPTTPTAKRSQAYRQSVWAIFPVRSPLLRKSSFLSLPEDTEMFQFSSFASATYGFSRGCRSELRPVSGFGHLRINAWLAAPRSLAQPSHVLRRLSTPKHPPDTLNNLTTLVENLCSRDILCSYFVVTTFPEMSMSVSRAAFPLRPQAGLRAPSGGRRPRRRGTATTPGTSASLQRRIGPPGPGEWWRRQESNLRPPACKAGALPTELRPRPRRGGPMWTRTTDLTLIRRTL